MEHKWRTLMASQCSDLSVQWNDAFAESKNPFSSFDDTDLDERYRAMRVELVSMFDTAESKCISLSRHAYDFDLSLAIDLYRYMGSLGMTAREASDDGVWRYIQMRVVPDQIFRRWGLSKENRINEDRFWKKPWRMYLKILWWYVHLSYNGSLENTERLLRNNSSNDISQLVERTGEGFRMDYTREIMRRYGELPLEMHGKDTLSHILMLNNIKSTRVDPELNGMSVEAYVNELFRQARQSE